MRATSVSIIIPAYKASQTIGRALDSVMAQTRRPDQVLVVDDGSPDDMSEALAPFRRHIRLIRKENGGAASARNLGIDCSDGKIIGFLDADDYWEPRKLQLQLEVMRRHAAVGLCASRYCFQEPGGCVQPCPCELDVPVDRPVRARGDEILAMAMSIWTSTVLVRREALGQHRFEQSLSTAEDRDMWIRLVMSGPVYLMSERLATLVAEPYSLSRSDASADYANMLRVLRRYRYALEPGAMRRWEAMVFRKWAADHLGGGQPQAALRPAWNRLRREPLSVEGWWILLKSAAMSCRSTES